MRRIFLSKSIAIGAAFALFGLSSCSQKSSDSSKITLTLPDFSKVERVGSDARFEKNELTAMSYSQVTYVSRVMLNVHGADIPNPIFYVAQSHDVSRPVPSTIQITVPTGTNRLIQALLILKTVTVNANNEQISDGAEKFYYGDVLKSLTGDDTVDLDLTNVATAVGADGAIAGRLIEAATSNGPTGLVNVQFAPPNGRLPMTVTQTEIHGGWFNFMAFEGLAFKYVMRDGRVLVPDMNISAPPTSPGTKLGHIVVPPYFKVAKDGSAEVARTQVAGHKYLIGYFGDGVPVGNKFCYDNSTSPSLDNAYTSATANDSNMVHWAGAGAPTALLAGVSVGGQAATSANCGGANYLSEIHVNTSELASHDRVVDFFGPFRTFTANDSSKKLLDVYLDGTHINVAWAFLPGVVGPARVTAVSVYTRLLSTAPSSDHGDPDYAPDGNVQCDRLTDPNFLKEPFTFRTAIQASPVPVNSVDLGAIASASELSSQRFQVVACPINDFGLQKFTSALGSASMGGGNGSGGGGSSATQLLVKAADDTATALATPKLASNNLCFPVLVQAANASGQPAFLTGNPPVTFTLAGDSNVAVHYAADCSDTVAGPYAVQNFNGQGIVYLKTTASAAYRVNFTASGVTPATYYGTPATPVGPLRLVASLTPDLYANSCEPIRFTAVGTNGALADTSLASIPTFDFNLGGATVHYYQESDGLCSGSLVDASGFQIPPNRSSAYARVKYYGAANNSSLTLTPTTVSTPWIGGSHIIQPLSTTVHQPGAPARVQIMVSNQMSADLCQPFTISLVDAQGHATPNDGSTLALSLTSSDASSNFNYASSSVCGAANGSPQLTIPSGSVSSTGQLGYTPRTVGAHVLSGTIISGQSLIVDPRNVSVTPAVANHLVVLLPGQALVAGAASGSPTLMRQGSPMQVRVYALTPSNAVDTNYSGPFDFFSITSGTYATNSKDVNFTAGYAQTTVTPTSSAALTQAQAGSSILQSVYGYSGYYFVEPNPGGTPTFRLTSMDTNWASNRCQVVLLSLVHAAVSAGGQSVSSSLLAQSNVPVDLSVQSGPASTFYSAPDCTGSTTTQVQILAGQRAKLIGVIVSGAGNVNLMASSTAGYASATMGSFPASSQSLGNAVIASPMWKDFAPTYYTSMLVGTCAPIAVALTDGYGAAPYTSPVTINPSSTLMQYYSDPTCSIPLSSGSVIPTGQTATLFYGRAVGTGTDSEGFRAYNNAGLGPYNSATGFELKVF